MLLFISVIFNLLVHPISAIFVDSSTLLHHVSAGQDTKQLVQLIQTMPRSAINAVDSRHATPLHYAAQFGSIENIAELFKAGADLEVKKEYGLTALALAVMHGRSEIVQFLCSLGADLNAQSSSGGTALHFSLELDQRQDSVGIVDILIRYGACLWTPNNEGKTPVDIANIESSEAGNFLLDHVERLRVRIGK